MKKFLINTTSTLMSAAVVGGVLLLASAPAKADTADFLKVLAGVMIIKEVVGTHDTQAQQPQIIDRQVYNQGARQAHSVQQQINTASRNTVCYSEFREATNGTLVRYDYNCQGNVLSVSR